MENKRLHHHLLRKIPGIKQEYKTTLNTLISLKHNKKQITWLPKKVNLYLIKKHIPRHKKYSEIKAELIERLLLGKNAEFGHEHITIRFVCDVELELDEDALEGVC